MNFIEMSWNIAKIWNQLLSSTAGKLIANYDLYAWWNTSPNKGKLPTHTFNNSNASSRKEEILYTKILNYSIEYGRITGQSKIYILKSFTICLWHVLMF